MLRVIPQGVGAAHTGHCASGPVHPSVCPAMGGSGLLPVPLTRQEPGNAASEQTEFLLIPMEE